MSQPRQLPKAYLKLDPDIHETHPEWEWLVLLTLKAHRQPWRGRFADLALVEKILVDPERVARFLQRGDLVQEDGVFVLSSWDDLQEGDLEVNERMRRYRERKRTARVLAPLPPSVPTSPSPAPRVPSEAGHRNAAVTHGVTQIVTQPSPPSETLRLSDFYPHPPTPAPSGAGERPRPGPGPLPLDKTAIARCATRARELGMHDLADARWWRRQMRWRLSTGVTEEQVIASLEAEAAALAQAQADEEAVREGLIAQALAQRARGGA